MKTRLNFVPAAPVFSLFYEPLFRPEETIPQVKITPADLPCLHMEE